MAKYIPETEQLRNQHVFNINMSTAGGNGVGAEGGIAADLARSY